MTDPTPTPATAAARMRAVCAEVCDRLFVPGVTLPSVYLLVSGRLRCQAARGYAQVVDGFPPLVGVIGRVVATGRSVVVEDVTADPDFIGAVPGLVAEVCVPIVVSGRVAGAVSIESRRQLEPAHVTEAHRVADELGDRIEELGGIPGDSLGQRLARAVIDLTALGRVGPIEERTVRAATELTGLSSAAIARLGSASGQLTVTTATGPLATGFRGITAADLAVMAGWVVGGTSSYFPGGGDAPVHHAFLRSAGIVALSVHPLMVGGDSIGLLLTGDERATPHEPSSVEALELLAAPTASALRTAELLVELETRASQDPLTGLGNLTTFMSDLEGALADPHPAVACLLVDLDHFKSVNDTAGHPAGDRLLRSLAAQLSAALRTGDRAYRLGGDEFGVIARLPDGTRVEAIADRLVTAGRDAGATVSVGTAAAVGGSGAALRARADRALYAAKAAGRDQAAHADPPPALQVERRRT